MRRIIQRRRNVLNASCSNQAVHPTILCGNVGDDFVEIRSILYVDSPIVQTAFELSSETSFRFVEFIARLW